MTQTPIAVVLLDTEINAVKSMVHIRKRELDHATKELIEAEERLKQLLTAREVLSD